MTDIQSNVLSEMAGISGNDPKNIKENSQLSLDHNFTNEEIEELRERLINYYKLPSDSLKITSESSVQEIVAEIQENLENN